MEYDGSFPWQEYQVHLESVSFVNAWSEDMIAARLVPKLRGPALKFVAALGTSTRTNYKQLLYLLQNRFGIQRNIQTAHSELRRRTQRAGESLDNYAREVVRLTRLAYPDWPDQVTDRLALEQFLDGIADGEVQLTVRMRAPKTTSEACYIGQTFIDNRAATRTAQKILRTAVATLKPNDPPSEEPKPTATPESSSQSGNEFRSV